MKKAKTLDAFIFEHGLGIKSNRISERTDGLTEWGAGSSHWRVDITRPFVENGRTMTIEYTMGSAHKGEPKLPDVLDCMASDASTYENCRNFSEWCAELGCDDDSIEAKRTYDLCAEQAKQLRHLLGKDAFDELLYGVERL